jgi:hypothetical protein
MSVREGKTKTGDLESMQLMMIVDLARIPQVLGDFGHPQSPKIDYLSMH